MEIQFSCPKCSSLAKVSLTSDEVQEIKENIQRNGRSPTLIAKCENGHDLLVTLYFRDDELGIRDVAVPISTSEKEPKKPSELDWVRKAFGGSNDGD